MYRVALTQIYLVLHELETTAEAWFVDMHSITEMDVMADDSGTGEAITYHGFTNTIFAASKPG